MQQKNENIRQHKMNETKSNASFIKLSNKDYLGNKAYKKQKKNNHLTKILKNLNYFLTITLNLNRK